jgi:hypothetical protein
MQDVVIALPYFVSQLENAGKIDMTANLDIENPEPRFRKIGPAYCGRRTNESQFDSCTTHADEHRDSRAVRLFDYAQGSDGRS